MFLASTSRKCLDYKILNFFLSFHTVNLTNPLSLSVNCYNQKMSIPVNNQSEDNFYEIYFYLKAIGRLDREDFLPMLCSANSTDLGAIRSYELDILPQSVKVTLSVTKEFRSLLVDEDMTISYLGFMSPVYDIVTVDMFERLGRQELQIEDDPLLSRYLCLKRVFIEVTDHQLSHNERTEHFEDDRKRLELILCR